MGEYSDKELKKVCDKGDQWFDEFSKSPFFDGLTKEQKEESGFIIATFTEYMYTYHSRTPEEWDEKGLEECCLGTLPRKITADESYYRSIAPVLSVFFNFIGKQGLLKHTANLIRKLNEIDEQIVENSTDSSNWGMAKSFMMSAKRSGVNLGDKNEIDAFLLDKQQRQLASLMKEQKASRSFKPVESHKPVENRTIIDLQPKVGRNEPCPCGSGKKYKKCCGW